MSYEIINAEGNGNQVASSQGILELYHAAGPSLKEFLDLGFADAQLASKVREELKAAGTMGYVVDLFEGPAPFILGNGVETGETSDEVKYSQDQPRDGHGRFSQVEGSSDQVHPAKITIGSFINRRGRHVDDGPPRNSRPGSLKDVEKLTGKNANDILKALSVSDGSDVDLFKIDGAIAAIVKGPMDSTEPINPLPSYEAFRQLSADGKHISNVELDVRPDLRGHGIGTELLKDQVDAAERLGVETISLSAVGGNDTPNVTGYRVWPKLGFDGEWKNQLPKVKELIAKSPYSDTKTIGELMRRPGGIQWWKENGMGVGLTFDVRRGSESRKVLDAYVSSHRKN